MKRRALLVGINYEGSQFPLRGCVNDVVLMNDILVNKLGFSDPKQVRMLTNESATTQNILERLQWLVDGAEPGDVLYFHYSGHGSQFVDMDYDLNDEPDGYDEVIVPVDMNWRDKIIKDDDFKRIFKDLPEGVNLTVTLDCCHSGSGLRDFLPPLEIRDSILGPTRERGIRMPVDIMNRGFGLELKEKSREIKAIEEQKGLLISGCASNQTSADAWFQPLNNFYGALTVSMVGLLQENNFDISYIELVNKLNFLLSHAGFSQIPELNGKSELFNKKFLQSF